MPEIKIRDGEPMDVAIRRFKRECEREGILQEIRKREFYVPPSVKRKQKIAEAKRRLRRRKTY
ncbi:MAG: 30S ribosomal protein S21 [Elusimicrobia bacterium]|nr:30S ribosomal protein S21 [Elusimicrobiota bacterium]